MNQLVVIGNGFDRKHNMDTTYEDFKKYCSGNKNLWLP